jgi:phosphoserine phosphatase
MKREFFNAPMNQQRYAILDFDGTLIRGQSQRLLVGYLFRKGYISFGKYVRIMLWYIAFTLNLTRNVKGIADYAVGYLKDKKISDFDAVFDDFFAVECIPRMYKNSYNLITLLLKYRYNLILLSTAIDPVISRACAHFGINEYISTQLSVRDGVYLGTLSGEVVFSDTKARIKDHALDPEVIFAFADHGSDMPLLYLVGNPVAVNPSRRVLACAQAKKWPVLYLDDDESFQHFESYIVSERYRI